PSRSRRTKKARDPRRSICICYRKCRVSVQTFEVGEDEEGMRLDRWFKRRIPMLSLSHLNKIVRTGEVRVDGARVKSATRLVKGQSVRVPPLNFVETDAPTTE